MDAHAVGQRGVQPLGERGEPRLLVADRVVHELDQRELVAALDAHSPRQGERDDGLRAHAEAEGDLAAHAPEGGEQHVDALQVREVAGPPAHAEAELDLQALCRGRRRLRPAPAGSARVPCTPRSRCSHPTGSRR